MKSCAKRCEGGRGIEKQRNQKVTKLKEVQMALVLASIGASISLTHKQANMEFRCMQFCRKLCGFSASFCRI